MLVIGLILALTGSRPARGAWIEIIHPLKKRDNIKSRPARGAWIEMSQVITWVLPSLVAPRKGRVD